MPDKDGSLTDADRVTFRRVLDRLVPAGDPALAAGKLGILAEVEERAARSKSSVSALLRVVEALSLDLTAHAIGGFAAMTVQEQTDALLGIERALPDEFALVLGTVRDVYYEDDRTPARPVGFDSDDEVFGKAQHDTDADRALPNRRSGP